MRLHACAVRATTFAVACLIAAASCRETSAPRVPAALLRIGGDAQQGTAGQTLADPLVVEVVDPGGGGVPGIRVAWRATRGGHFSADTVATDAQGLASVRFTLDTLAGPDTLEAEAAHLDFAAFTALALPGPAAKLKFLVQPNAVAAGVAIAPALQVAVLDALGNTVGGAADTITLAITGGTGAAGATLGGTVSAAAVNGLATFADLTVDKVGGSYTLTATAGGLAAATCTVFAVSPGPPARLVFSVQPSRTAVGAVIRPAVEVGVQDAEGNTPTVLALSATVAITAGSGTPGAHLGGTATITIPGGRVTFSTLSIDSAGAAYTLTASAPGLTGAVSVPFDVVAPGPPAKLAFIVPPGAGSVGRALSPAVQVAVEDDSGSMVTTATTAVTLALGANPAGGTLSGTTTVAAVGGVAMFSDVSLDRVGSGYTLTATAAGLSGATSAPFVIASASGALSLSAGGAYDCLVTADGAASCWGANPFGALGNGTGASSATPGAVSGGLVFAAVSAGYNHTCGVTAGGAGYCWGDNRLGELGSTAGGDLCASYFLNGDPQKYACKYTPVAVSGGLTFMGVSAGSNYSCGLTSAGAAYCWGASSYGALGNGSTSSSPAPVAVSGGLTFAAVSANYEHTCGLTTGGSAWCWGYNPSGQLGNGSTASSQSPAAVSGGLGFAAVSAGFNHTCGVTTGGAAWCWGANDYGQLGAGSTTGPQTCLTDSYAPVQVPCGTTPVAVAGSLGFATVSAGYFHTCGVTPGGAAWCWGSNGHGELGTGSTTGPQQCVTGGVSTPCSPTPVAVSGALSFRTVSAGYDHTCGLTIGGAVYCWGNGNGTPVLVTP